MKFRLINSGDIQRLLPGENKKYLYVCLGILVGVLVFLAAYFNPFFKDQAPFMSDIQQYKSMAHEHLDYFERTGEESLWNGSMFGGMPTYQMGAKYPGIIFKHIHRLVTFGMPFPMNAIWLYFIGFFLLLKTLRVNNWISLFGAASYALSSYFFIASEAGHTSKMYAMGYLAPMLAGLILTMRGKYLFGFALTTLSVALQMSVNHFQVTYYSLIVLGIAFISYAIGLARKGDYKGLGISTGLLMGAALLGLMTSMGRLSDTNAYKKYSIRGPSVLSEADSPEGLPKGYAFQWSYGPVETWSLMVPGIAGDHSGYDLSEGSNVYGTLRKFYPNPVQTQRGAIDVPANFKRTMPVYHGPQPFTSGPVYIGVIIVFMFFLGLLIVADKYRWWILAVGLAGILMSWGDNFKTLNYFLFDHLPLYNSFRAPSMVLLLMQFAAPLLAALALKKLTHSQRSEEEKQKALKSVYIAGGLSLLLVLLPIAMPGSFLHADTANSGVAQNATPEGVKTFLESQGMGVGMPTAQRVSAALQQMKQQGESPADAEILDLVRIMSRFSSNGVQINERIMAELQISLNKDRMSIIRMDALRSLLFLALALGLIWVWLTGKFDLKNWQVAVAITAISVIDLTLVDLRYFNSENFQDKDVIESGPPFLPADQGIRTDNKHTMGSRVLNLASDPWQDATTGWYHRSVGGYNPAKLRRYNDLIRRYMDREDDMIQSAYNQWIGAMTSVKEPTMEIATQATREFISVFSQTKVLNMMNVQYVILNPGSGKIFRYDPVSSPIMRGDEGVIANPFAMGEAWFVNEAVVKETPDALVADIGKVDLRKTALLEKADAAAVEGFRPTPDPAATIRMTSYQPNRVTYQYKATGEQLAVFSEVYYGGGGWKAKVNGQDADLFRVNYVLRGLRVPGGSGTVELYFDSSDYVSANSRDRLVSILVLLIVLGAFYMAVLKESDRLAEEENESKA